MSFHAQHAPGMAAVGLASATRCVSLLPCCLQVPVLWRDDLAQTARRAAPHCVGNPHKAHAWPAGGTPSILHVCGRRAGGLPGLARSNNASGLPRGPPPPR